MQSSPAQSGKGLGLGAKPEINKFKASALKTSLSVEGGINPERLENLPSLRLKTQGISPDFS